MNVKKAIIGFFTFIGSWILYTFFTKLYDKRRATTTNREFDRGVGELQTKLGNSEKRVESIERGIEKTTNDLRTTIKQIRKNQKVE